jgi:hypothetical protein
MQTNRHLSARGIDFANNFIIVDATGGLQRNPRRLRLVAKSCFERPLY